MPSTSPPETVPRSCWSTAIPARLARSPASSKVRSAGAAASSPSTCSATAGRRTPDAAAYLLPGHALALIAIAGNFGLDQALFVGWSLGGSILLEAARDLPRARGFAIFGAPPIGSFAALADAFLPNPALATGFSTEMTREQAEAYVASFFAPGFADIPAFFVEDALRADGRARAQVAASLAPGVSRDEVQVAAGLKQPLAVLHGAKERFVNSAYFARLTMPTLWRGAVQTIDSAGHAPQWETPVAFDALIEAFAVDCGG